MHGYTKAQPAAFHFLSQCLAPTHVLPLEAVAMVTTYDTQLHEGNDTEEMTKVRQTPVRIITPASAPLLDGDYKSLTSIKGWPIKPGQIKHGKAMYVSKLLLDFTLLACAIAFLAFALMVCRYDQASTSQHPQATAMLESATKYVSNLHTMSGFRQSCLCWIGSNCVPYPLRFNYWSSITFNSAMASRKGRSDRNA
jgi:hypothetical protein